MIISIAIVILSVLILAQFIHFDVKIKEILKKNDEVLEDRIKKISKINDALIGKVIHESNEIIRKLDETSRMKIEFKTKDFNTYANRQNEMFKELKELKRYMFNQSGKNKTIEK